MAERLYSTYQVADLLGATPAAVVDWMRKGLLSYERLPGGPVRVSEKGLIRFLKHRGISVQGGLAGAPALEDTHEQGGRNDAAPRPRKAPVEPAPTEEAPPKPVAALPKPVSVSPADEPAEEQPPNPRTAETREAAEPAGQALPDEPSGSEEGGDLPAAAQRPQARTAARSALQLVDDILGRAVECGATHIHLAPGTDSFSWSLRLRIGNMLQVAPDLEPSCAEMEGADLIALLKSRAGLDPSITTRPQSGRLETPAVPRETELRLMTCPSVRGETAVIRVWDRRRRPRGISDLGLSEGEEQILRSLAAESGGLVIVTGPPRHGANAVLWALAAELNSPARSICCMDRSGAPYVEGVNQARFDRAAGFDFAMALRTFAELDPDVILATDLPDGDAAAAALDAACDGRLVLVGLNTPSPAAAVERLLELDVDPSPLSTALLAVVAARIARRLCDACKKEARPSGADLDRLGFRPAEVSFPTFEPRGCAECGDAGYRGETILLSTLRVDKAVAAAIREMPDAQQALRSATRFAGTISLREAGLGRLREGIISLEELVRVAQRAE